MIGAYHKCVADTVIRFMGYGVLVYFGIALYVTFCEDFRTPAGDERLHPLGWPAFENLQRTKPRGIKRGRAATACEDLMAVREGIRVPVTGNMGPR